MKSETAWAEGGNPEQRLEFDVSPSQADQLERFLVEFAQAEDLEFYSPSDRMVPMSGGGAYLATLYRAGVADIAVMGGMDRRDHVFVFIYEPGDESPFSGVATRLIGGLKDRWPNLRPYEGP